MIVKINLYGLKYSGVTFRYVLAETVWGFGFTQLNMTLMFEFDQQSNQTFLRTMIWYYFMLTM